MQKLYVLHDQWPSLLPLRKKLQHQKWLGWHPIGISWTDQQPPEMPNTQIVKFSLSISSTNNIALIGQLALKFLDLIQRSGKSYVFLQPHYKALNSIWNGDEWDPKEKSKTASKLSQEGGERVEKNLAWNKIQIFCWHKMLVDLGKTSIKKKRFLSGIARMMGVGGLPMPEFFGPLFRSAFLVNKKSLFLQKCQCIELLIGF